MILAITLLSVVVISYCVGYTVGHYEGYLEAKMSKIDKYPE